MVGCCPQSHCQTLTSWWLLIHVAFLLLLPAFRCKLWMIYARNYTVSEPVECIHVCHIALYRPIICRRSAPSVKMEIDEPLQSTGAGLTCCLIDNGIRCHRPTGNASYSKRIAKTVAQRRLKLVVDQMASPCSAFCPPFCRMSSILEVTRLTLLIVNVIIDFFMFCLCACYLWCWYMGYL